eukprot:TRINITY_DN412_c0_g1_i8.p1 TRINITY_DN412_c0_g1~~TRINITY_DN412_c0_g1_i8.p1  ORF type:complete len:376 (-),score=98.78 TRINITY_DN412_c0_g1_i8:277-1404(-)
MGGCGAKSSAGKIEEGAEEVGKSSAASPPEEKKEEKRSVTIQTSDAPAPEKKEPPKTEVKPAKNEEKEDSRSSKGNEDNDSAGSILEGIHEVYDLGKEIGRGGFSVVVEATRKDSGKKYAVRCIKKSMVEGDDIILLKREISIMKKIDHPNILKLFEVYEEEEDFYLVMELVNGKELFDKIVDRGQYSEKDASNIVKQIVAAIEYLHDKGIAHRDLKPENLLSSGDEEHEIIKIADFGFSKQFGEEQLVTSCGSPGYVAPEVLTQDSYDKSVDMWSLGVIIYILLCGFPPFYADTPPELFKKIMDVKYDFDDPAWDNVSEAAKNVIRNLLVKDPQKRWTAQQCLRDSWVQGKTVGTKQLARVNSVKVNNVVEKAK